MTIHKKDKDAISNRLARIAQRSKGRLTPEAVVEDAENPRSPLHPFIFNCDDGAATYQYRLHRARKLIASIQYESRTREVKLIAPRYVRDPNCAPDEQGYIEVIELKDDRSAAREALETEIARVISALERARAVASVLGLERAFDRLLQQASGLGQKIKAA